jgi:phage protein D
MSSVDLARRAKVKLTFQGVDVTEDINKYFKSLTFTDNEADEADDLQITFDDREDIWLCSWLNDAIEATGDDIVATASGGSLYSVTAKTGLNVRSGPGTSYSKLGSLAYGTAVSVIGISNSWASISYNGSTAYVSAGYLTPSSGGSAAKGFSVKAQIIRENWESDGVDKTLDCGVFELDSVKTKGPPATITMKATSLPYSSSVRQTKKSKSWEKVKLSAIANEIASKNGMACMFESRSDIFYTRVEQVDQSDIAFLRELCIKAGLSLKVTANMLVLFDQQAYESAEAAKEIKRGKDGGYSSWDLSTGSSDTNYIGCRVRYTEPGTGRTYDYTYYPDETKKDGQVLEIREKVSSSEEAKILAKKRLRQKNKFEKRATFDFPGDPDWLAGITVRLTGWGAFDGNYIVSSVRHSVSKSGGYTTSVSLRRVLGGY